MHTKQKLKYINNHLYEHLSTLSLVDKHFQNKIIKASDIIIKSLKKEEQYTGVEMEAAHLIVFTYQQNF